MTVGKDLSEGWEGVQLTMIWTVWLFNQYAILVIMLNFLIAVINDTYVKESSVSKMHKYRHRNDLNLEYCQIRDCFFKSKIISCKLIVSC